MAKPPTKAERAHFAKVAAMPCVACGRYGVNVHHVTSDGYQRLTKRHDRVVPLCEGCHQYHPDAVHKIGHRLFNAKFDIDLLALAEELANG
jgi:hypothetical protein